LRRQCRYAGETEVSHDPPSRPQVAGVKIARVNARKKPTARTCISIFVVGVLAYLLSFGPAIWLVNQRWCPDLIISAYFVLYLPIWVLGEISPQFHDAIDWYAKFWS
jgi:hypothetical protein